MHRFLTPWILVTFCACGTGGGEARRDPGEQCEGGGPTIDPAITPALSVVGDVGSVNGIFDPSVAYPYVSYTTLEETGLFTRIAKTDGATFTYVSDANAYADITIDATDTTVCGSVSCAGRLVHETSSLIRDDETQIGARYKLFDYSAVIV